MLDRNFVARGLLVCVAVTLSIPRVAEACGCDCTPAVPDGTPVDLRPTAIAHRVVLSVSAGRTVMWDQFMATGDQHSFAWLFPVRDASSVEVVVGSQAFVDALDTATSTLLQNARCPPRPAGPPVPPDLAPAEPTGMQSPLLEQQSQSVEAGPVEVATIDGSDPNNVIQWIATSGFEDPAARHSSQQPNADAGVAGGPFMTDAVRGYAGMHMDFIAVRFTGGTGVTRMPPVRLTFTGYDPSLPLRGIAVGGAPEIGIEFIVLAPSGMQPQNYPFQLLPRTLSVMGTDARTVYDTTLRQLLVGDTWLIESMASLGLDALASTIGADSPIDVGAGLPVATGIDDAHAAFDPLGGNAIVTRMQARVSTAALGDDLVLAAAPTDRVDRLHFYSAGALSTFPDGGLRCQGVASNPGWSTPDPGCRCAVPGSSRDARLSRFALAAVAAGVASISRRRRHAR